MKRNGIAGILAAVLLSAWSLPAGAEETYKLDPVLVTAEKRTENVQDVPVSVTAISEQQIKDSGIRSIQDVARQVPNLFIANWGFRGNSYAFIRGIGAVNNDPAIGFYVDDVNYMDSRVFDTNLFDIERIEVLRGPLKWLGGLYLYKKHQDHTLDLNYGQGAADMGMVPMAMTNAADSDIKTYGYAVFGQATYTLFDKLDLTAGLRYEYEKNKLDYASDYLAGGMVVPGMSSDIRGRKHDDVFLPKAQIAYRWTPDFMTYAGVSRGYRSGGFNTSFLDVSDLAFDPEYSWNYEVGFKSSWFNNRVNFNTSLFYIDLSDQQVTQVLPTANTVIRNAGKSRSMGFEVEASALITEGLLFEGSFGYTDAKYRRYSDKVSGMDYAGNRTPLAPEYTYNLALQYSLPLLESFDFFHKEDSLTWITRAELQGVGKFYWNDANTLKQDPYELVNLRTGLETDNYSITFWAKNVFDKKYNCVAFAFSGSSALAQVGAPRSFGVTFRADF